MTTSATITQRAYTLRLRGIPGREGSEDEAWREALWRTHETINKGTKVFADWLLTLRGGLDHRLTELSVTEGKGQKKTERRPDDQETRHRRIMLALSWLSVESADGAPAEYIVATGKDAAPDRKCKIVAAL